MGYSNTTIRRLYEPHPDNEPRGFGDPLGKLIKKLLFRLPTGGFRLTDLGARHDENVICKIHKKGS